MSHPKVSSTVSSVRLEGALDWLLTRSALSQLMADPAARAHLQASRIYEILQPGQTPLPGVAAEPVITFASAAALEQAVVGGRIPAAIYGVLYDPEAWSFTPPDEQRDPALAATKAAAVAHARGLRLLVAPALNLTTVLAPGRRLPRWQVFLNLDLAGHLATVADVIDLQAQSLERDTATYTTFVRTATAQAIQANPGITVLAGLSTNPPGAPVDTRNLTDAIQATRSMVDGYWLNIPGQGPRCPTCNSPRPDIAVQTLQAYAG
jgi:NAD(P)-dependent dehydrogenase (short-subunit alcohol dehydrogenase family)